MHTGHIYAKMFLNKLESLAPSNKQHSAPSNSDSSSRDRKRGDNRTRSNREVGNGGAGRKRRSRSVRLRLAFDTQPSGQRKNLEYQTQAFQQWQHPYHSDSNSDTFNNTAAGVILTPGAVGSHTAGDGSEAAQQCLPFVKTPA